MDNNKKLVINNESLVPTINKIVKIVKHYFKLDLSDKEYEKIFNVLIDAVIETNKLCKKNNLLKKSQDTYKTLLETILFFFKSFSKYYNSNEKK